MRLLLTSGPYTEDMAGKTEISSQAVADGERIGPPSKRVFFAWWFSICVAVGLLQAWYFHLATLAEGYESNFAKPLVQELTGVFGAGLIFFGVLTVVRKLPLRQGLWLRHLPGHVCALVVLSMAHTTWNWGTRELLFRLVGLGDYDYGIMPVRYVMELPVDVISYSLMVAGILLVDRVRAGRERELKLAMLEGHLAQAELRNLRLQLQPHFLFNALNTISSTMYDDPAAADEMLDSLSSLLRASLRTARTDVVSLAIELETVDAYLKLLEARFGDRLAIVTRIGSDATRAMVPSMVLQPLLENAVRHGGVERSGTGEVMISAEKDADDLVLQVADDGPGSRADTGGGNGLGLSATRERLKLLYGDDFAFSAENGAQGGFLVTVRIPYREAS